jgi:hypothetical protein
LSVGVLYALEIEKERERDKEGENEELECRRALCLQGCIHPLHQSERERKR